MRYCEGECGLSAGFSMETISAAAVTELSTTHWFALWADTWLLGPTPGTFSSTWTQDHLSSARLSFLIQANRAERDAMSADWRFSSGWPRNSAGSLSWLRLFTFHPVDLAPEAPGTTCPAQGGRCRRRRS